MTRKEKVHAVALVLDSLRLSVLELENDEPAPTEEVRPEVTTAVEQLLAVLPKCGHLPCPRVAVLGRANCAVHGGWTSATEERFAIAVQTLELIFLGLP